jgi:hypothetical protein
MSWARFSSRWRRALPSDADDPDALPTKCRTQSQQISDFTGSFGRFRQGLFWLFWGKKKGSTTPKKSSLAIVSSTTNRIRTFFEIPARRVDDN